jgi:hypothetical protein
VVNRVENEQPFQFDTPLPGKQILGEHAQRMIESFLKKFKKVDPSRIPTNIPTACLLPLRGPSALLKRIDYPKRQQIYFFLESPHLLFMTDYDSVIEFEIFQTRHRLPRNT